MVAKKFGSRREKLSRYDVTVPGRPRPPSKQSLKNQIRSLERLIRSDRLSDDVLANKKKLLNNLKVGFQSQKQRIHDNNKNRRLAIRYHQVRFLERVKIVRKLKRAKKEGNEELFLKLGDDLRYVLFFPKGEMYISILKGNDQLKDGALEKRNQLYDRTKQTADSAGFVLEDFLQEQSEFSRGASRKQEGQIREIPENQAEDDFFL